VQIARDTAVSLRTPQGFQSLADIRAAFAFADQLLCGRGAERLPFDQSYPILISGNRLVPSHDGSAEIVVAALEERGSFGELPPQDFAVEVLLGAEAVKEHPMIDPGAARDRIATSAGQAVGGEFGQRRLQDPIAGTRQVPHGFHREAPLAESLTGLLIVLTRWLIQGPTSWPASSSARRTLLAPQPGTYQRIRLAPQVRPPPQALSMMRSLSWMRRASTASSSAIGTEAAEVFP